MQLTQALVTSLLRYEAKLIWSYLSFQYFAGDESYEQIEKGQVPHAHNGSKQDFGDGDEVGKLE